MIYLEDKAANQLEFENLLLKTSEIVKRFLRTTKEPSKISGANFEQIVYDASLEGAKGTSFGGKLRKTNDREFPDIVDDEYFGVEVKATKKDDWVSIGNSVLESSRVLNLEKIYVFFGKLGGEPDVKYRTYEECLKGIAVTHYPRYQIDMLLQDGESIFDKMGTSYQELRSEANPVKGIRSYYRNELQAGEELWWINDNLDDSTAPSPIIKFLSSMSVESRDVVKAEIFVLFPKILSNDQSKFNEVAAYLVSAHGIITSNLRDHFSAGGQMTINHEGKEIRIPQIVNEMLRIAPLIIKRLEVETPESLANQWQKKVDGENAIESWEQEIDNQSAAMDLDLALSQLFKNA